MVRAGAQRWGHTTRLVLALCGLLSHLQAQAKDTNPSFTIFACPKPFSSPNDPQARALRTWLALRNAPQVVLIGADKSLFAVAAQHERVRVEPEVDTNFLGTPLFHSIMHRALHATTDFAMFLNSDILLFDDIVDVAIKLKPRFSAFVATAARWDLEEWPFQFASDASDHTLFVDSAGKPRAFKDVRDFVHRNGTLHAYGGTDVWLWNTVRANGTQPLPLHKGLMPPFAYGRGKYDNWLNHEIENTGLRDLVDFTTAATTVHVAHRYDHVNVDKGPQRQLRNFWSQNKRTSWEQFSNIVQAQSYGTYANQLGTLLHTSWKLASCAEPAAGNMCLSARARPAQCSCEYSSAVLKSDKDPVLKGSSWTCGSVSVDSMDKVKVSGERDSDDAPAGLPHTLEQLLPKVADASKTVVLTGLLGNYGSFLMNFVCQARKLGVSNVLVAAFDDQMYEFAFLHGIPVFKFDSKLLQASVNSTSCFYGTTCFRSVTKSKSRATLAVLKLGYNVLFSDVDIVWFENPLPHLQALGANGDLLVQSNEPNATLPANGKRRINSGFYYATSSDAAIAAFSNITEHSAKTKLSEQPSFYDVLCGEGRYRVGDDACKLPGGIRTVFLNRDQYPNGAHLQLWQAKDVRYAASAVGAKILHNNWAVGEATKKHRQSEFWYYDEKRHLCEHAWLATRRD